MLHVVNAWHSLLTMFVPLVKTTLKTALELYWLIVTQVWWLLGLGVVIFAMKLQPAFYITWIVLWTFFLIIMTRPSLAQKNFWYCVEYAGYSFGCMGLFFVAWYLWYVHPIIVFFLLPYFSISMFFLCDSYYTWSDIIRVPLRAAKLAWAIAPFSICISFFAWASWYYFSQYLSARIFILFVDVPCGLAFMSRVYCMAIHKEYKEYYERCW